MPGTPIAKEPEFKLTILYGELKLIIKPPWIRQKTTKNIFGCLKHMYFIHLEYVSIGPFSNYFDAYIIMKNYHHV